MRTVFDLMNNLWFDNRNELKLCTICLYILNETIISIDNIYYGTIYNHNIKLQWNSYGLFLNMLFQDFKRPISGIEFNVQTANDTMFTDYALYEF